jgi:tetratricopeptide (TPR) repeat protein
VSDPALLRGLVAELEGAIDRAPPGEPRWSPRTYVADALDNAGQADEALPFYREAAAEAETAGHWSDLAWITGNWANAAGDVGDLEEAKGLNLRSAEAYRRAGNPEVNVIGRELEALRNDVMKGEAGTALPEVEARLDRVRGWWRRIQAGKTVAEAPDRTVLGRALVSGLNIAQEANQGLERSQACLDLLEETESAIRALGESKASVAETRFNQHGPLLSLGRLDEAQGVLEGCLEVFRSAGAVNHEADCLSALADLWNERNEIDQAIALERQALAVRNTLPDPSDRAISHHNLSGYYDNAGQPESAMHNLAAGVYFLVIGRRDHLTTWMGNLRIRARRALAAGGRYRLPRLSDLLAREDLAALRQFLDNHKVDPAALQAQLDRLVEQAHE